MFEELDNAIQGGDPDALQRALFDLGRSHAGLMPDEISFRIIDALRAEDMRASPLAGHLLNHFEFHSRKLSNKAKDRCVGFLRSWGDSFTHVHSRQVVAELREGNYLHVADESRP